MNTYDDFLVYLDGPTAEELAQIDAEANELVSVHTEFDEA